MTAQSFVLLVEDDDDVRDTLKDLLRGPHRTVRAVADGTEALALLEQGVQPTVVLSDIMLPGVLGTSVAAYLQTRRDLRDVPFAFVTGSPELAPPGYRVFRKPVKVRKIRKFLEECEAAA